MSDQSYPTNPQNRTIRPITRGMMRHLAANQLPAEAAWTLRDFVVFRGGLQTIPRYLREFAPASPITDDVLRTIFLHWEGEETFSTLALGDRFLYNAAAGALTKISWDRISSTGTLASLGGRTFRLTDVGQTFMTDGYTVGDSVFVEGNLGIVQTVTSETELDIQDQTGLMTTTGSMNYTLEKSFAGSDLYQIQFARLSGTIGSTYFGGMPNRSLIKYTISGGYQLIDLFPSPSTTSVSNIRTVEGVGNRLMIGNFTEDGVDRTNRIRWSPSYPFDVEDFTASDSGFLDFLEVRTGLVRLLALGPLVIAYFGDQIHLGRPTNISGLPFSFTRIDTGNIGLVGPRAIARWIDGHFFVGQDDIYYLTVSGPPQPIGTPVLKETIQRRSKYLQSAQAVPDPSHDRIMFIFPDQSSSSTEIWSFNYKDQAWSYKNAAAQGLGFTGVTLNENIIGDLEPGSLDAATYDPTTIPDAATEDQIDNAPGVIDDYKASFSANKLFVIQDNEAFRLYESDSATCDLAEISPQYESVDLDFDLPDIVKTVTRLNIKLEFPWEQQLSRPDPITLETIDEEDETLAFGVEVSHNRGRTWKNVGTLRIVTGSDEGKVNFRLTGSLFRFRITFQGVARPIKIVEVGIRVKRRAEEVLYR